MLDTLQNEKINSLNININILGNVKQRYLIEIKNYKNNIVQLDHY